MKFLGLKIFIGILELMAFLLITPCLIIIASVLFDSDHPFSLQSIEQSAVAAAIVSGALFIGVVILALAQLLNVMICIEHNTAVVMHNTASLVPPAPPRRPFWQSVREWFRPVRASVPAYTPPPQISSFCHCGAALEEQGAFCSACGAPVEPGRTAT